MDTWNFFLCILKVSILLPNKNSVFQYFQFLQNYVDTVKVYKDTLGNKDELLWSDSTFHFYLALRWCYVIRRYYTLYRIPTVKYDHKTVFLIVLSTYNKYLLLSLVNI